MTSRILQARHQRHSARRTGRLRPTRRGRDAARRPGRRTVDRRCGELRSGRGLRAHDRADVQQRLPPPDPDQRDRCHQARRRPRRELGTGRRRQEHHLQAPRRGEIRERQSGAAGGRGLLLRAGDQARQDARLHPRGTRLEAGEHRRPGHARSTTARSRSAGRRISARPSRLPSSARRSPRSSTRRR